MAEHNDFPLDENTHEEEIPDLIISSRELPDVVAWKNRQNYDITITHRGMTQMRRTELEDGTVLIGLRKNKEPIIEGELSS